MLSTEDKLAWCELGADLERTFVDLVGSPSLVINPEKEESPYVPDLLYKGSYADLKCQTTPYFKCDELGDFDPQFTVTFNRKDVLRYNSLYPNILIFFWVNWQRLEGYGRTVRPMNAVWAVGIKRIIEWVNEDALVEHAYGRRVNDNAGNAKSSYLIDLRTLTRVRV